MLSVKPGSARALLPFVVNPGTTRSLCPLNFHVARRFCVAWKSNRRVGLYVSSSCTGSVTE